MIQKTKKPKKTKNTNSGHRRATESKGEPLHWTCRAVTGNHLSILSLATEAKQIFPT